MCPQVPWALGPMCPGPHVPWALGMEPGPHVPWVLVPMGIGPCGPWALGFLVPWAPGPMGPGHHVPTGSRDGAHRALIMGPMVDGHFCGWILWGVHHEGQAARCVARHSMWRTTRSVHGRDGREPCRRHPLNCSEEEQVIRNRENNFAA